MPVLFERNDALETNPQAGVRQLSTGGSSWLFAVTALFLVATLAFVGLSFKPFQNERIFHYFFIIALLTSTISYYATASGLGYLVIQQHLNTGNGLTYQIYYTKYINWAVSFPSILIALGLVSGVSWATIVFNVFLCWIWIVSWLVAAFTPTIYKWGFFAFGLLALFLLAFQQMHIGRTSASRMMLRKDFMSLAGFVTIMWVLLYTIAWGVSDGGNVISVTASFIFFGILDLLVIIGSAAGFAFLSRKWDYSHLGLAFTQHGRVNHGAWPERHSEKKAAAAGAAGGLAASSTSHNATGTDSGVMGTGVQGTHGTGLSGHTGHTGHTDPAVSGTSGLTGSHGNGLTGTHGDGLTGNHGHGVTGAHGMTASADPQTSNVHRV